MTQQSGTAMTKLRRVFVTIVVAAVAVGTASQAVGLITDQADFDECMATDPTNPDYIAMCCLLAGGDLIEILDDKENVIETGCAASFEEEERPEPSEPPPVAPPVLPADVSAPDTVVDSGPKAQIKRHEATFFFSAEPNATFACSLDGADFAACVSPLTLTGLRRGQHTLQVVAIDEAGNRDNSPALSSFK
jgi:hypothetical protein